MEFKFVDDKNPKWRHMSIVGSHEEEDITLDILNNMNLQYHGVGGDDSFAFSVRVNDEKEYQQIKARFNVELSLSKMTEEEKESHIEAVEMMIDYGEGYALSDEDMELYNLLTAERSQKAEITNEKAALDNIISSAEQRRSEQDEINIEEIDRELR